MNRRDLLVLGTSAVAASVTANIIACADSKAPAGSGSGSSSGSGPAKAAGSAAGHDHAAHGSGANAALAMALAHCEIAGNACLAHCLVLLGDGDTSMGGCARAVRDMLAVCEMMSTLVSSGSAFFKDAAALCAKACGACKRECEKHIADHPECKACFDGCDAVLAELAKV
jgi:Cys-rich four helix bundle protein (predicted Tat secretion target)